MMGGAPRNRGHKPGYLDKIHTRTERSRNRRGDEADHWFTLPGANPPANERSVWTNGTKPRDRVMDCGGKRSATPLWQADQTCPGLSESAVALRLPAQSKTWRNSLARLGEFM